MDTVSLLREVINVMEENTHDGYREFQYVRFGDEGWFEYPSWSPLVEDIITNPIMVRRRPRTIKVRGHVPEYLLGKAHRIVSAGNESCSADAYILARALLDLIEQPVEEK